MICFQHVSVSDGHRQRDQARGHRPIPVNKLSGVRHHDIVHERHFRLVHFHRRRREIQVRKTIHIYIYDMYTSQLY